MAEIQAKELAGRPDHQTEQILYSRNLRRGLEQLLHLKEVNIGIEKW